MKRILLTSLLCGLLAAPLSVAVSALVQIALGLGRSEMTMVTQEITSTPTLDSHNHPFSTNALFWSEIVGTADFSHEVDTRFSGESSPFLSAMQYFVTTASDAFSPHFQAQQFRMIMPAGEAGTGEPYLKQYEIAIGLLVERAAHRGLQIIPVDDPQVYVHPRMWLNSMADLQRMFRNTGTAAGITTFVLSLLACLWMKKGSQGTGDILNARLEDKV